MQIILLILKIISIPLIIIIGESDFTEKNKTITLLIIAFLYNNLIGSTTWFAIFLISALKNSYLFILSIIIIGFSILIYLITINKYIKKKIDVNTTLYISLNVIGFLTGIFLI